MVIILGCIMGVVLQKSGAAMKMADVVVKWVGPKHPGSIGMETEIQRT